MPGILVAEDNRALRESVRLILEQRGFDVTACSLAGEALEACREQQVDLAVVDVSLPDQSGFDLVRQMREDGFLGPVIICSGLPQLAEAIAGCGAEQFLGKPYLAEELIEMIQRLLLP